MAQIKSLAVRKDEKQEQNRYNFTAIPYLLLLFQRFDVLWNKLVWCLI